MKISDTSRNICTLVLLLSSLQVLHVVDAFTAGAPPLPSVCRDMVPQHHEYKPQTVPDPYFLRTDRLELGGGEQLKVYINSTDETKVRGFYIQARDSETNKPIGTFIANKVASAHSCGGKRWNAVTHNNGHLLKDSVEIVWVAPDDYEGEVLILGTVLRDFVTFWSGLYAEPVTVTRRDSTISRRITQPINTISQAVQDLFNALG